MRRDHASAAVLLGGWLLLLPRPKDTTGNKLALDIEAPLSQWEQVGAFDSQAKCRRARAVALAGKLVSTEKEAKTGERVPLPADARDFQLALSPLRPCRARAPAEGAEAKVMALGGLGFLVARERYGDRRSAAVAYRLGA